ncbi:UDP-2,3-diacylglucosamine diphosphatase [Candidimonas sp. SYP-B2681]|uniref:UDP-2,3-diacylglucosamine diphosphatase n=1 Tax=Candidimonas sp. SYP-B2681 TaxID=2497686 RepID=UPI000F88FBE0|nr:UDP-2,3-diacylglucosamine diphosphatase [Candidimonas sp. SYP-B2681]RTZ44576.1 UDP-2,3-diacylglucosamine diphosphatase [Candidimonas sp. SYP-B2681]
MNKIPLAGTVWIASDIHLGPNTPATAEAFDVFLDKACAQADALILCGDIFDAWIGDDFALSAPPEWLAQTLNRLKRVSTRMPLWLGRGNRDFLIGTALADHVGGRLLPDSVCLDTDCGRMLLSHGDEYCTFDKKYQRFRRIVRNPVVQRLFLGLSLTLRRNIADWARNRSMNANRYKSVNIMDVNPVAIAQAFTDNDVNTLIHGHTHRPAIHHLAIAGRPRKRIVLPDWDYDHAAVPRGGWLSIDRHGPVLHQATW